MKKFILFLNALLFSASAFAQPSSWNSRGVGGGGALFSPSINPANTQELYIACDMTELFHSTDFGASWSQVHFTELQASHDSKVCFTATANLLYCVDYANDLAIPVKSTDGGLTWSALAGNPDNNEWTYSVNVDYNNPQRVILSYYGELFISQDGGNTFTSFHTALNNGAGVTVGGVFFDGNMIFAGTNDGLLVSSDGGATWTTDNSTGIPNGQQIWSFAAGKSGNTTRLLCLTGNSADIYVGLVGSDYYNFMQGIYTMDWGSNTWTPRMNANGNDFPMFVGMAGNNSNTMYAGGSNSNGYPHVLQSTNGGVTWAPVFNTASNQNIITGWSGQGGDRGWGYGECIFGMAVAANDANTVAFGDFGFVHVTNNGGTSWRQAYTDIADQHPAGANTPPGDNYHSAGLENTTSWQVHWMDVNNVFACYSDIRGMRSTDGGLSWSFNYTGLNANSTYRIAQHPTSGTIYAATSNIHDMYQSTRLQDAILDGTDNEGKILYSTNNGQTWQLLHNFGHPVFWIVLDPNNANRAYASVIHYNGGNGIGGVYRCDDLQNLGSSTWTLLADPPRTQKHPASLVVLNDGSLVATFSGRRTSAGAFTNSSGTFIYDPSGNAWTDVSDPGMHYWTKDVVIDPNDAQQNTWYVGVYSGWGGPPNGLGGLYKTTNRGQSWTRINALDRVASCTFNPNNPNEIYVTTEQNGLWMSSNINATTPTFSAVSSYPFRQPERVFFNPFNLADVWVTSFGNGMKMGSVVPNGVFDGASPNNVLHVFPNPVALESGFIHITTQPGENISIYDVYGKLLLSQRAVSSLTRVELGSFSAGVYFVRAGDKATRVVCK